MGASATACPICAAPALVGDDEVIDLTETTHAGADDPMTPEELAPTEDPSTPSSAEHEVVHAGVRQRRHRPDRARELDSVPSAPPGRTRPKTPLPPYVPPTPPAHTAPPPPPPPAPEQPDLSPALLEPAPLPPPPAPSSARPWTAPPGAAWPGVAPANPPATPAGSETPSTAHAAPSRRRAHAARALLVLLVLMVAIGVWWQWERITDVFGRAGDESSVVADIGEDPDQAPVVEGRFERSVGSVVTQTTLESTTT